MEFHIAIKISLYLCIFSCAQSVEFDNFYVERSGHTKVKPGEIAVVFYMTVANSGSSSKKVYSKNTKCCWKHPDSTLKYDCESMDLHGGIPVTLAPSKKENITYLFTNLYPLDRVGQCVFHLWHANNKIAHTIRFNTAYKPEDQDSWLGSFYKKISGGGRSIKACDTVDLDPRHNCKPVNCVQKYNGKRNFFRKKAKLCEPVFECYTSRDDEGLPTTAFDKDHNKCKSLIQKDLTKDEERNLRENVKSHMEALENAKFRNLGPSEPIPVRCNHGKRAGNTCICDNGWRTDTSTVPLGDPKFVYNWCNVKTRKKPFLPYQLQKRFMIVGLSLTSFTLLVTWLWMIHCHIYSQEDDCTKSTVWEKTTDAGRAQTENAESNTDKEEISERTEFSKEGYMKIKDAQIDSTTKSKLSSKGKSTFSFIKHSAKKLLSFSFLSSQKKASCEYRSIPTDEGRSNLISTVTVLRQEKSRVMGSVFSQEGCNSVSRMVVENISEDGPLHPKSITALENRCNSLPGKLSCDTMQPQTRSYSLPSKIPQLTSSDSRTSKKQDLGGSHFSEVKDAGRIVASRKMRSGSTYTLTGPQKRLSTTSPVLDNAPDSD